MVQKVSEAALRFVRAESFRGPLPHPSHLGGYERVLPGAAERILRMAEDEQKHRHRWENRSLSLDFVYSTLGLMAGAVVASGLIAGAYFTARSGHDAVAGGFLIASAASMVTTFVKGRELFKGEEFEDPVEQPNTSTKLASAQRPVSTRPDREPR